MANSERLLEFIEDYVVEHGGDLGGWTRRTDDALQLFDGRATLRVDVKDGDPKSVALMVHAHVLTTLHEHDDEVLEACVVGMGKDQEAALRQAAGVWLTGVAGPIRSFLDDKPVCMTCQAGVVGGDAEKGYAPGSYGLSPGLRGYVGPAISRAIDDERIHTALDDTKPWFRYAAESAAPRRVHLAKATVVSHGKDGWHRELEIDGHEISHHDPDWPGGVPGPDFGYLTRYAVFEFPRNSSELLLRIEVERTIRHFAENFAKHESVDSLINEMIGQGFAPDLVQETESFSTMAFGRVFFETSGVRYSPNVTRARRDGRVQRDVPLMGIPAYSRARALAAQLRETMSKEDFQALCLYSAESGVILQAIEASDNDIDMSTCTLHSTVVPELGVSDQTMNEALATLNPPTERKRPSRMKAWWKFW